MVNDFQNNAMVKILFVGNSNSFPFMLTLVSLKILFCGVSDFCTDNGPIKLDC